MSNSFVIVITGSNMGQISNRFYKMIVSDGSDHSFVLEEFIEKNKINYPFWDYCFSHDAVKLAVLGSIVILTGELFHIVILPNELSFYQKEILKKIENLFNNEQSCFSIINIYKECNRVVYEEIHSDISKGIYAELIEKKYQKFLGKSKILRK